MSHFSHIVRARAMRQLLVNGGMWGAYGQLVVITGPIFTGFALWMGLKAADIALVASIVALSGLIQPFSSLFSGRLRNPKGFIIRFGILEICFTTSVILLPLLIGRDSPRFVYVAILTLAGTFTGNLVAPLFNTWFSTVLPEEARARFMGKRLVIVNLAAMAVGYGAGQFIDKSGGGYIAFVVAYAVAWLVGAGGYWALIAIPFPSIPRVQTKISLDRTILAPFENRTFRRLLGFYLTFVFGALIADPFYSVFLIQDLGVSYAIIGVLNAVVLGVGVVGYRIWGGVAGRFGSKPVLELLLIPRLLLPLAWTLMGPQSHLAYLFIIMICNGLVLSGITVAINTLLFGSVPEDANRTNYFAMWAFSTSLVSAAGSAVGGFLVRTFGHEELQLFNLDIDGVKIAFLLSGLFLIVPVVLIRRVRESNAKPVLHLIGQVLRGNSAAFVYNSFVFSRSRGTRAKARAARAMGRSRNPMAVDNLAKAMNDLDPAVRQQAIKGLGDTRAESAVSHLAETLANEESDMRAEAADSLGRIRHPSGIDPLLEALESQDTQVAISAARALGDIGGAAVIERLYKRLRENPPKTLLPTLVESSSRLGDIRVVTPALVALVDYTSPVVRLQMLNAVCRALGARNLFYTLLSYGDYELAERLDQMLRTMERRLIRISKTSSPADGDGAILHHRELRRSFEEGEYAVIPERALSVAESIEPVDPVASNALEVLRIFAGIEHTVDRPDVFSIVCLGLLIDTL